MATTARLLEAIAAGARGIEVRYTVSRGQQCEVLLHCVAVSHPIEVSETLLSADLRC